MISFVRRILCLCIVFFALISCSSSFTGKTGDEVFSGSARVACWNVQTFFDSENRGNEYSEFAESKKWGREMYEERIRRLCSVIKSLDAEVFVMEEIENESVLHDISNYLSGEWNMRKVYSYGCFAANEGSSIGIGILSRLPLENMTVHNVDCRRFASQAPLMRPVVSVEVLRGEKRFVLVANHWKSMSGGESETEKWRFLQENILCDVVNDNVDKGRGVFICGDFNRDIEKFVHGETHETVCLRGSSGSVFEVTSPWYGDTVNGAEGSYYFNGSWSRIDNLFSAGALIIEDFNVCTEGPWCDAETKVPVKYKIWDGSGYSDHLPLQCTVKF